MVNVEVIPTVMQAKNRLVSQNPLISLVIQLPDAPPLASLEFFPFRRVFRIAITSL